QSAVAVSAFRRRLEWRAQAASLRQRKTVSAGAGEGLTRVGGLAMSESQPSRGVLAKSSDPEMERASENARETFRYFWREMSWERRRIVPALDLACVKAPFSDGNQGSRTPGAPEVEHMWISDVDFDGQTVSGVLMNSPNWLKTIKEGD